MSDPLVGRVLDGRYEILAKLARGGMATVYRAQDHRLTRIVAIKVMHEGLGDDAEFARKFDREARSAATLSNPHVVSVFDQGLDNGRPYIVMEFVQGCTLRHVITREAPLPPLKALDVMENIASALSSAHEAGLVHRDVKPENVLLSDRGQIKVADFGLARAVTSQTATATQGLLIGTVSYLPPELVTSGRADARSDVYSAGVVLFEMLTGQKPHKGETPIQVAYSHVHNDIPAPSTLLAGNDPRSMDSRRIIPPYLDALVVACTRRSPDERPVDGRELLRLVRTARHALAHGILDDPALTRQMSASMTSARAAQGGQRPEAAEESTSLIQLQEATSEAPTQLTPAVPTGPVSPTTPVTRQERGPITSNPYSPMSPSTPQGVAPEARPLRQWQPVETAAEHNRRVYRRRRVLVSLLFLLMLALTAALGSWWWISKGRYEAAPSLESQPQASAVAVAKAQGLALEVNQEYSETVPKGVVIRTEPEAGDRVLKDTSMTAWVSRGPERYPMPSVVGQKLDAVRTAIQGANLTVGKIEEKYDEKLAAGVVSGVDQAKGTQLKRGTTVNLVVSKGPQPITIEDFTGKTEGKARDELTKAGFKVATATKNSDDVKQGRLIEQSPRSGTGKRGDTVTITVSKGPVMVTVPAVAGKTEAQATAALKKAGFTVKVVHATPEWLRADIVRAANPVEGKQAKKASEVTLWVV